MQREKLIENFKNVYSELNAAQKEAVDKIDGPVMVIAGPGTGKTQILSSRIANILLQDDVYPHNILCLTYTDSGAIAMRQRLQKFIGADAYKVTICTYHGFCNDVIQNNLAYFRKGEMEPIGDIEKVEIYKEIIDLFDAEHPLKRYKQPYNDIANLQKLFELLKRENWSVEYVLQKIANYENELKNNPDNIASRGKNKGELKADIKNELKSLEKLKAAVQEFNTYERLMDERNLYDFDDMIRWVIAAFNDEESGILQTYQEQYLYVLVDEFQDSNGVQNQLVDILCNYWESPNLFVVGDDDQSIFRFQGAEVENMMSFADKYATNLKKIVLTENYRSTQPILDAAKGVINRNQLRLVKQMDNLSKDLVASNVKRKNITVPPTVIEYASQHDEMIQTTLAIEQLVKNGVPPGNIAVLYRNNDYGHAIADYLQLKNIPVYSKKFMNLLTIPLTKKIINVLRYLVDELDNTYSGDARLFEILHYDWFNIQTQEIAIASVSTAEDLYKNADNGKKYLSIRHYIQCRSTEPPSTLFENAQSAELTSISQAIEKLIKMAVNSSLQELVQAIVNELHIMRYILQSDNKHWHLQVLTAFFNLVKNETRKNKALDLKGFVALIDLMEDENIVLPLYRTSGNKDGVNLLTCHGSKGLEFEHVFLVGTNKEVWEGKKDRTTPFSIGKVMAPVFDKKKESSDSDNKEQKIVNANEEELRRLFYVALTRAETNITVSYHRYSNKAKNVEPSVFVSELCESANIEPTIHQMDANTKEEFVMLELTKTIKPIAAAVEKEVIERNLNKFSMNVSALNNFMKCPLRFYFNNLIKMPATKNSNMSFGTAVHAAIETLFKKMRDAGKEQFPAAGELVSYFKKSMEQSREGFSETDFKRFLEYGEQILTGYYNEYVNKWNKVVVLEYNANGVVDGVPIKGKIDKLEFNGNNVVAIDYKTGDYTKQHTKDSLMPPCEKMPNGGDYWRQAVFYKILVDGDTRKNWKVVQSAFDFIEPKDGKYCIRTIDIGPEDITTVKQQIKEVWQKIQNHDFYTGCGKNDCPACNMLKENKLAVDYIIEDGEEENFPQILEQEL